MLFAVMDGCNCTCVSQPVRRQRGFVRPDDQEALAAVPGARRTGGMLGVVPTGVTL